MELSAIIEIINLCIISVGVFAVILSVANSVIQKRNLLNIYSIGLYLSVGFGLLNDFINHSRFFPAFPHFAYVNDCLEFFIGAFFYIFFKSLLFPAKRTLSPALLLFVPAFVNLGLYMPFFLQPAAYKATHYPIAYIGDAFLGGYYGFINKTVELWVIGCIGAFIIRCMYSFKNLRQAVRSLRGNQSLGSLYRYFFAWIIAMGLFFMTNFLPWPIAQRVVIMLCSVMALTFPFVLQRHALFFAMLQTEVEALEGANAGGDPPGGNPARVGPPGGKPPQGRPPRGKSSRNRVSRG